MFYEVTRKAANLATNVNAVLFACERSRVLFSKGRLIQVETPMPKKRKQKDDDDDVYEVEDILADAYDKKV